MPKLKLLLIFSLFLLFACETPAPEMDSTEAMDREQEAIPDVIDSLEVAHKLGEYLSTPFVAYNLLLGPVDTPRWYGQVTQATDFTRIRMDRSDGTRLYYDGQRVYQSPDTVEYPKARFDIFTWTYFFALPYKLSDPGVIWEKPEKAMLNGKTYLTAKLSFENGVGDTPEDWYLLYINPQDYTLHAAAYIVTYGKNQAEAEEDPHILVYGDYRDIDGIPIAHSWTFYGWSEEEGLGRKLMEGTLSDVNFSHEVSASFFEAPAGSKSLEYEE